MHPKNTLQATVKDTNHNPVAGADVTFTVITGEAMVVTQKVSTGTDGIAKAALTSQVAGDNQVTASVSGKTTAAKASTFVADESSAVIAEGNLTVTTDNGATVGKDKVSTDKNGEASTTLTSTTAGLSLVTATVGGSSQTVNINFIPAPHVHH